MANVEIRELRDGDIDEIFDNLRPADRLESEALLGPGDEKLRATLTDSVTRSVLLWVGTAEERVACIFGVCPASILGGQGIPWLLGTPLIDKYRHTFLRQNPRYIAQMLELFPTLINVIDARNVRSIAWLKRMGFTILTPRPIGVAGLPFHPFFMEA